MVLIYLAIGALAGLLAGLLGIGGGLVVVPCLSFVFAWQHLAPDYILHMALGTSLASILFTSVSSMIAHHKRGGVLWRLMLAITPGILVGTLFGTFVASWLSTDFLKGFFGVFLLYVSAQMFIGIRPPSTGRVPGPAGCLGAGSVIGLFSSLVGIGGGTLSVPFLVWCNTAMHKAIGTSAAIGFPIAVAGTAGYIFNGLSVDGLPPDMIGFIHLPALTGIVVTSVLTAPLGAKLAYLVSVDRLKKIFAVLLFFVGMRMLVSVFFV